ncbi:MAG: hypothetical protein HYY87_03960 [Candidatus Levybacteria bacterium]|nr:hypothetical protein [Candidatus Levybacteria bacterium]MBI3070427.1 hypothetical protein [Candidatus Levybacteria bacterium]
MAEQQTFLPTEIVEQIMGGKFERYVSGNPDSTAHIGREDVLVEVMPVGVNQFWRVIRLGQIDKAEIREVGLLNPNVRRDLDGRRATISSPDHEVVIFSGAGSHIRSK